jgi:hypothetical protein
MEAWSHPLAIAELEQRIAIALIDEQKFFFPASVPHDSVAPVKDSAADDFVAGVHSDILEP